jgi:peptidoglycan/xylan/chitin deacetylase (PgdA/CDA1 family)
MLMSKMCRACIVALAYVIAVSLLLLLCNGWANATSPRQGFWPNGTQAAVSLTFDDGMPSQLQNAVPLLNRLDLKATFFVNPAYSVQWNANAKKWARIAAQGHEVGNHTDRHPCSCQDDFRHGGPYCLERLDRAELERAIDSAERALADLTALPAEARSFAYPCYHTDLGSGPKRESYVPLVAKRYPAARVGAGYANDPETVDLWYVSSLPADGRNVQDVIRYVDAAAERGRWAVIVFHGIGSEWNAVSASDFELLVNQLAHDRKRLWIAPFVDVAKYIRGHRTGAQ